MPVQFPKQFEYEANVSIGRRLRERREKCNITQTFLADCIGVTFQQIQKHEKASNRISAGRLLQFSLILNVPVSYFFQDQRCEDCALETTPHDNRGRISTNSLPNRIEAAQDYFSLRSIRAQRSTRGERLRK